MAENQGKMRKDTGEVIKQWMWDGRMEEKQIDGVRDEYLFVNLINCLIE